MVSRHVFTTNQLLVGCIRALIKNCFSLQVNWYSIKTILIQKKLYMHLECCSLFVVLPYLGNLSLALTTLLQNSVNKFWTYALTLYFTIFCVVDGILHIMAKHAAIKMLELVNIRKLKRLLSLKITCLFAIMWFPLRILKF